MKNSRRCIVYAFDTIEQLPMLIFSIKSFFVNKENLENDFLLIISEKIYNEKLDYLKNNFNEHVPFANIKIKSISPLKKEKEGMFYWFFAPFLSDYNQYLFLDNDTIINGDISNIWNSNNNFISGVKTSYKWNEENKKIINFLSKGKTFQSKRTYINTGVVLLNGDFIRGIGENKIREIINDFYSKINNHNLKISDQEFLFSYFGDFVKSINKKWNLRLSDRFFLSKFIRSNSSFIFHYNIFIDSDNGNYFRKFNYKILLDKNITSDHKETYLMECYKKTNFYLPLLYNKKYIKSIVELFQKINNGK